MEIAVMILEYLRTHPHSYQLKSGHYQNAITLTFSANIIFPYQASLFRINKLESARLPDDFITAHADLVAWLSGLIYPPDDDTPLSVTDPLAGEAPEPTKHPTRPASIWLTASHVTAKDALFLEVSFE